MNIINLAILKRLNAICSNLINLALLTILMKCNAVYELNKSNIAFLATLISWNAVHELLNKNYFQHW